MSQANVILPKPLLDPCAVVHLARSSQDVFHRCVTLALNATRATTVMVLLHRPETGVMEVVAAAGHLAEQAVGRRIRPGEALAWRVFGTGQAQLVCDPQFSPDALFISGKRRPGMYLGVPLLDPDGQVLGVLSVDTTDSNEQLGDQDSQVLSLLAQTAGVAYARLLVTEQAQRSAHRFERLARLFSALEALTEPAEIAGQALETLIELSGFTSGAVFERRGDGAVALTVTAGRLAAATPGDSVLFSPHVPEGIVEQVLNAGSTLVVADYANWPYAPEAHRGRIYTALSTPLRSQGRVMGVIGLANLDRVHPVSPEIVTMLELVAARIDRAVERDAGIDRLRRMREAALRALGRVLEVRDDETFGHTDRVTALAVRLGTARGLGQDDLEVLRWGAYLHDIGKVAVPDDVLRKPGQFTPEERHVMQRHVVIGDEMLRDEDFLPNGVREVVRHHHERWDGGGYPDGLSGGAIPLLARIFSVVDVYDALISERPYKPAWSHEVALAELNHCAGTQFDPEVVQAFLALVSE
ncbi:GAF domain-containing protein (plasmid) [Deinococcus radiomollis]|uniref:HD domain-containing phosphohydrolase n=1 Tax=Deinococcus radiomollis TaxID=468916 RepID=UPI0038926373